MNWAGIVQLAKQLQPQILVWMGPEIATTGAELRWIGNENGQASRTTSSIGSVPNGGPSNVWYPFETNVSDRVPNWFWHPNNTVMSLSQMQTVYFRSVGMNTTLIFNVPPGHRHRPAPALAARCDDGRRRRAGHRVREGRPGDRRARRLLTPCAP